MASFEVPDLEAAEERQESIARPAANSSNSGSASSFQTAFGFAKSTSDELKAADARHAAAAASSAAQHAAAVASNTTAGGTQQRSNHGEQNEKRPLVRRGAGANLLVSHRQKGNPVLSHIRQVAWEHADIKADYIMTPTAAAVFISVRYHLLNPQYVYKRMRELRSEFELRVLLIQVDVDDCNYPLQELCRLCVGGGFTAIVAWSAAEAARYLETYKAYERKGMTAIKPRAARGFVPTAQAALTKIRGVNKTDSVTLLNTFGSVAKVAAASAAQLQACPGLAEKKVSRLREAFHQPFSACGDSSRLASNAKRRRLGLPSVQEWRTQGNARAAPSADSSVSPTPASLSSDAAADTAPEVLGTEGMLQLQPVNGNAATAQDAEAVIVSSDEDSD